MNFEYCDTKTTSNILNTNTKTLQLWSNKGLIETTRTETNYRRYNVKKYCEKHNLLHLLDAYNQNNLISSFTSTNNLRVKVIYCRVSSHDRKADLIRQIKFCKNLYPEYDVISDIGSGINFKRKGLKKIIDLAIANSLEEVVVTYKDRLCRIGYELIEHILTKYSSTTINIINKVDNDKNEEITKDLIEIITVYSSKLHGSRSNKIT